MAKSLDQFEYEMQHQRFLKVLSEALYEIQDNPEPTRCDTPIDEQWIEVLAGDFVQKCEDRRQADRNAISNLSLTPSFLRRGGL
jgi:hypothetical protein